MNDEDNGLISTEWREMLDERQLKELDLAIIYEEKFHHGTTGHNQLMLIAKLAHLLDDYASHIQKTQDAV